MRYLPSPPSYTLANGRGFCRRIFFAATPRTGPLESSSQTMAPVGQRSIASRAASSF